MLPILRIVPVGGVFLAIVILVLALTPPDGARAPLTQRAVAARGPLIDRDEHPEWRQLFIRAALRRADELNRLRELPDTPMRIAPVVPAENEVQSETSNLPVPETSHPPVPETQSEPVAPVPSEPLGTDSAKLEDSEATSAGPEIAQPVAVEPAIAEPPAAPPLAAEDAPKRLAGLPVDRNGSDPAPDDVTGSIDEAPSATIRIDIGETSSTELPVMLPEQRPPVVRTPEPEKPAQHSRRTRVRKAKTAQSTTPLTFFDLLFGTANTQEPQAPATQPNGAKKTAASDSTVLRDFSIGAN